MISRDVKPVPLLNMRSLDFLKTYTVIVVKVTVLSVLFLPCTFKLQMFPHTLF